MTPGQSGLGSNVNEGVPHTSQRSRIEASPSNGSVSHSRHSLEGLLLLCRDAVGGFYRPSQGKK